MCGFSQPGRSDEVVSLSLFMILGDKLQHLRFPLARGLVVAKLQLTDANAGGDLGSLNILLE